MMRTLLLTLVLFAAVIHAAPTKRKVKGACERIHPEDLPDECSCSEPHPLSLVIECTKPFDSMYFNDTIGMKIVIDPCDEQGSSMSLDVTEKEHHIDYKIAGLRAGEEKEIPIPGLSVIVPGLGSLGVDAAVLIMGNVDQLTMKVGLNACAVIRHKNICASSIPGLHTILPWWVLYGTYSFGDLCNATKTAVKMQ
jgi:hypothetical protein